MEHQLCVTVQGAGVQYWSRWAWTCCGGLLGCLPQTIGIILSPIICLEQQFSHLGCTVNHLERFKNYWGLSLPHHIQDRIALQWGLGPAGLRSSLGDYSVQPRCRTPGFQHLQQLQCINQLGRDISISWGELMTLLRTWDIGPTVRRIPLLSGSQTVVLDHQHQHHLGAC